MSSLEALKRLRKNLFVSAPSLSRLQGLATEKAAEAKQREEAEKQRAAAKLAKEAEDAKRLEHERMKKEAEEIRVKALLKQREEEEELENEIKAGDHLLIEA